MKTQDLHILDFEIVQNDRTIANDQPWLLQIEAEHPDYRDGETFTFCLWQNARGELGLAKTNVDLKGSGWAAKNLDAHEIHEMLEIERELNLKDMVDCDNEEVATIALALGLDEDPDTIQMTYTASTNRYGYYFEGSKAFTVVPESSRMLSYRSGLRDSLWLAPSWLIAKHVPNASTDTVEAVKKSMPYEDGNEDLGILIGANFDEFADEAAGVDGITPGDIIASYDGTEIEVEFGGDYFYVYRTN